MKKKISKKAAKKAAPKVAQPEPWAPPAEHRGLGLRTVNKDYRSIHPGADGFQWPKGNGVVDAPDWSPEAKCGGGLHMLANGLGDWELLSWEPDAIAQVCEYDLREAVKIDEAKIKVPRCNVIDTGHLADMMVRVQMIEAIARQSQSGARSTQSQSGTWSKQSQSGAGSTQSQSGAGSTQSQSGARSTQSQSGTGSKQSQSGTESTQSQSGTGSKQSQSGAGSTQSQSGAGSKQSQSGAGSTQSQSGAGSTQSQSGTESTQSQSGTGSKQSQSGARCVAMSAGMNCKIMTGEDGAFALAWHDGNRPRIAVGYAGENGIKPHAWYKVVDGKLTECDEND